MCLAWCVAVCAVWCVCLCVIESVHMIVLAAILLSIYGYCFNPCVVCAVLETLCCDVDGWPLMLRTGRR